MSYSGRLNFEDSIKCKKCNGSGKSMNNPNKPCGYCKGLGVRTK